MNRPICKFATVQLLLFVLIFNTVTSSLAYGGGVLGQKGSLYCTSQGYQWLSVESEANFGEQVDRHCKACLFSYSGDGSDDLVAIVYTSSLSYDSQYQAGETSAPFALKRHAYFNAQGRAPPTTLL